MPVIPIAVDEPAKSPTDVASRRKDIRIFSVSIDGRETEMVLLSDFDSVWDDYMRAIKNNAVLRQRIADCELVNGGCEI